MNFKETIRQRMGDGEEQDRQVRLGFPKDVETIIRENRIAGSRRFPDAPPRIAALAAAIEDMDETSEITLTNLADVTAPDLGVESGWAVDTPLNARGVDEFSKSSLTFSTDGSFLAGTIRVGTLIAEDVPDVEARWRRVVTDEIGLLPDVDDLRLEIRLNTPAGSNIETATPHIILSSQRPSGPGDFSPVKTGELMEIIRRAVSGFETEFDDARTSGRIGEPTEQGSEETIGNVDDMLENL
jgi:hypothetical protein